MKFSTKLQILFLLAFLFTNGRTAAEEPDSIPVFYSFVYHDIDSIKQLLYNQANSEKQKMMLYSEIAGQFQGIDLDSSIVYVKKSITIAQKTNDYDVLTLNYILLGINHSFQGNYDEALDCFDRSKRLAMEHKNKKAEAHTLSSTGFMYAKQGKHNTAIDYYLQYLKISESEGWIENYVKASANLSEINRRLGNTETAIRYLKQAEEKSSLLEESRYRWWMPQIYNEYAFNYMNKGDYDEAFRYALKADSINLNTGSVNKCYTKGLLTSIYLHKNDYGQALLHAEESYQYADILKDVSLYIYAGKILSDVYLAQKRYSEAEAVALRAWQIDSTNIDESRAIVENIAMANIYMGNMVKAAYYLKKYSALNAQFSEKSFQTTASDLSIKYETEKKEVRIASLEKERQLYIWLSVSGVLLIAALGIMMFQIVRNSRKEKLLITAKALQEGEMEERARIAKDLHDRLGGSLSAIKMELKDAESLQIIKNKTDECINELREIVQDIMPYTLKQYGMKIALEDFSAQFYNLQFHFFGEEHRIDSNLEYTVYCCAKELVINALKHSGAKNINLQLVQNKNFISLTVQDDGCGFDEKTVIKGYGLKNIYNRIASCKGKLDITSMAGEGTEAVMMLAVES